MAYVTSIINLKGGVGKTTITLALAHFLALEHRKRVLVIDLDPQTNATVCLIPEMEWKKRDETGRTLYQLFWDQLKGTQVFYAEDAIVRRVSNVGGGIDGLDRAAVEPATHQDSGAHHADHRFRVVPARPDLRAARRAGSRS